MILCSCRAVSDRVIRRVVADGARSVREVARATGAGTCCGSCLRDVAAIVRAADRTEAADEARLTLAAK
ncbi:MAG: (2Fe-2S)-binding protein [Myxococcota bacterium]